MVPGIHVPSLPRRVRWSFIDQVLVSGASFLTGVLIARAEGFEAFGTYALVMVALQFLAGVQQSVVLSPMMSLFDQRGALATQRYLGALIVHQGALLLVFAAVLSVAWLAAAGTVAALPITLPVALGLLASSQVQEFARRHFFVTERPVLAFFSDLIAHGGRLVLVGLIAAEGTLVTQTVWQVMIATAIAGSLLVLPDLVRARIDRDGVRQVSRRHGPLSAWLLGNMVVSWFSETGFLLIVIGAVLGAAEVGGVRAVLNLVLVVNLVIQSLENFVPSTASRRLVGGGRTELRRYLLGVGVTGVSGILIITMLLMALAGPVMEFLYGHDVPGQVPMLAVFGLFLAMGLALSVANSGLRALETMREAFLLQLAAGVACVALMAPLSHAFGLAGALGIFLAARVVLTAGVLSALYRRSQPPGDGVLP